MKYLLFALMVVLFSCSDQPGDPGNDDGRDDDDNNQIDTTKPPPTDTTDDGDINAIYQRKAGNIPARSVVFHSAEQRKFYTQ